ncbi:uncharacterized protein F5147DRAFT_560501, partial [Suillus discolor]
HACGLYCKLHKCPRPKSMHASHGEGRRGWCVIFGFCIVHAVLGCSTTAFFFFCDTVLVATPLWRKDDEGKTICNVCGLYYKLHGSACPISMKSDIIRKRSRHDTRAQRSSLIEPPSTSNTPG